AAAMNHSPATATPHLLLVEDDPVSAAFLAGAAADFPARVRVAGSLAEADAACAACAAGAFDLLLLDANLPDGRGEDLLRSLRERDIATIALAHTADTDAQLHARLLAAGFADVLRKPIGVAELHAALRRHLPADQRPCWDDAGALAALGQPAHVVALRDLFLQELPEQRRRIVEAAGRGDEAALRAELHRLVASCGFVGAARLGGAALRLRVGPSEGGALRAPDKGIDELLVGAEGAPTDTPVL